MPVNLPLFPLGTVLFPGLLLPLHIFEERYRRLVEHLVGLPEGQPRRFGVVAIREGWEVGAAGVKALHTVGCTAELREVEAYPDGRFDLVSHGVQRFHLGPVDDSLPYLTGTVELIEESDGEGADLLAPGVGRLFRCYRDTLLEVRGQSGAEPPQPPSDSHVLSYLVAAAMVLDLEDKQRLLACADTAARLREELTLLRREAALVRALRSLPATELVRAPATPN